jgi:hypothetical protein
MPKSKHVEAKADRRSKLERALDAKKAAQIAYPYADHSALEMEIHIARQEQIQAEAQQKQSKSEDPRLNALKVVDAAKANLKLAEKKLQTDEHEQSRLLHANYRDTAFIERVQQIIADDGRAIRQAYKRLTAAEERLERLNGRASPNLIEEYTTLKTKIEPMHAEEAAIKLQHSYAVAKRHHEKDLVAAQGREDFLAEQIAINYGPEKLHEVNEDIEQKLKTR